MSFGQAMAAVGSAPGAAGGVLPTLREDLEARVREEDLRGSVDDVDQYDGDDDFDDEFDDDFEEEWDDEFEDDDEFADVDDEGETDELVEEEE